MELTDELDEEGSADAEVAALAVSSRLLQLQYAWRLGMSDEEEARLSAEAEAIATRTGDLHSLAMLRLATSARPGVQRVASEWLAAAEETNRLADESGDLSLRVAMRAACSYAYLAAGDFDGFERELDLVLELADGDRSAGAGIVIGSPIAWATLGKAMVRRERGRLDEAEELFERALRIAEEDGDPEMVSWTRGNTSLLLAMRGNTEAGVAMARRNCEETERLGDVFSRTIALGNLGSVQLIAGDHAGALESMEAAERVYREAMGDGGEMEAWRGSVHARALAGLGRGEEAVEVATGAVEFARAHGMLWALPLALLALAQARAAAGAEGVEQALDEAAAVAEETGATMALLTIEQEREALGARR
jgi:tetratricopeptide (TPR) repeat protein